MPLTKLSKGTTLVEFLLASTLALLITLAAMNGWLYLQHNSYTSLQTARLHQDINAIIYLMSQDIRRAGFWGVTVTEYQAASINPFQSATNDIRVGRYSPAEAPSSCLLYSYDLDKDGFTGLSQNENFGFRLRDQAIEMRVGGAPFECGSGQWQDISENNTLIEQLTFTLSEKILILTSNTETPQCPAGQSCRIIRMIEISISGHLKDQPHQSLHANVNILLRNDKII